MKVSWKRGFTPGEIAELERKMQCINFLSRRDISLSPTAADGVEAAVAALLLSGVPYNRHDLTALLSATDGGDVVLQSYASEVAALLASHADVTFDESRIVAIYRRIWDNLRPGSVSRGYRLGRDVQQFSFAVRAELSELVEWLLMQEAQEEVPQLVCIAIFLHEFANNRTLDDNKSGMLQLIELLLLRRYGCDWVRLCTPARMMCDDLLAYHSALAAGGDADGNRRGWIVYWIDRVYAAALQVNERVSPQLPPVRSSLKSPLNPRQRRILDFVEKYQPVKLADIVAYLRKESLNTIKKDMYKLHAMGYVVTDGVLKGTVYYRN